MRPIPNNLKDRRVEITGPVDRKMIINALNSNVNVFMADFEDSLSPSWENIQNGLVNMRDAAHRTISFQHRVTLKKYNLRSNPAILMCRVRGLHLKEKHISCNGVSLYGALVEAYIFMKGEPDMMAMYDKRFAESLQGLKMLGEAKETTQDYRVGKIVRNKQ